MLIFIRDNLACSRLETMEDDQFEVLWILTRQPKIPRDISHILIGVVYHPPGNDNWALSQYLIRCLDQVVRLHPAVKVILTGDFNQFQDSLVTSFPLKQVVKSATRKEAILDKIFTNIAECYNKPVILPPIGKSDHSVVMLAPSSEYKPNRGLDQLVIVRSKDRNNKAMFAHALESFDWSPMLYMQDCTDMLLFFNNSIHGLLDQFLPTYTVKRHSTDKPWINDTFRRLIRVRQYAFRQGNLEKYKSCRNKVQRCAKLLRKKYYESKVADLRRADPRNWWSRVKNITGMSSLSSGALNGLANEKYNGDVEMLANEVNKFFHSVSSDLQPLNHDIFEMIPPDQSDVAPIACEVEQVERRLMSTCVSKSPGPDGIPNWILHDLAPFISKPITAIFNASIVDGIFPDVWKQSNVVPIPKSNPSRTIEDDLRPISLTPTLAKHLEWFVGQQLLSCMSDKLDKQQFGAHQRTVNYARARRHSSQMECRPR